MIHLTPSLPLAPHPTPEELVERLAANQKNDRTNLAGYLVFKQSKRSLKECAKKGELSEELRKRILSLLSEKGFQECRGDPRFRGYPVCSTRILFFSPRLWQVLFHPESHPAESALLQTLSDEAFQALIKLENKLDPIATETLAELSSAAALLKIPELETIYQEALLHRIETKEVLSPPLTIRGLYLFATIWPADREEVFSKLLSTFPYVRDSLPKEVLSKDMAKEFHRFNAIKTDAEERRKLSPETLFRFFLFIQSQVRSSPSLYPLRLELFDRLLIHLKSGELDVNYSKALVAQAQNSFDLRERLKQDRLLIVLESVGEAPVSPWPLFAQSDFISAQMKAGMSPDWRVVLEGPKAKSFFLLYDFWIKGKEIPIDALSIDQLFGLLECANHFQARDFNETRSKIERAILERSDNSPESLIALAETVCTFPSPILEEHVISWLKSSSLFSIQKEGGRYSVTIVFNGPPSFATLETGIRVLKILKGSGRLSKMELQPYSDTLAHLSAIHCCTQLELPDKEALEQKLRDLYDLEGSGREEKLASWSPHHVLILLGELSVNVSAHILEKVGKKSYFSTSLWKSVQTFSKGISATTLQEERARFEAIASDQTGHAVLQLSANEVPRFLFFLLRREIPLAEPSPFLSSLSLAISQGIRKKGVDVELLQKTLEDCRVFFPQTEDVINNLKIGLDYPDSRSSILFLPLQLLVKMERDLKIFSEGKIGDGFAEIPVECAQWAVALLDKVCKESKAPLINPDEAKTLRPAHFQALQLLQTGVFRTEYSYNWGPIKTRATDLTSLVKSFSQETQLAAASWAAAIDCWTLVNACSLIYCGGEMLQQKKEGSDLCLSSLQIKPLKMLKAIGAYIRALHVDVKTDPNVAEAPWRLVVEACPNLYHFTLYIEGGVPSLESLPLSQLPKLSYLTINPEDSHCWESLRSLKIPATINRIHLFIKIEQIKKTSPYEFFDNLPHKGVLLNLNFESSEKEKSSKPGLLSSWWTAMVVADPVETLFSHLSHCSILDVDARDKDCLPYIARNNNHLEELKLSYWDYCPSVIDLQTFLDQMPLLKKCEIAISLFRSSKAKDDMQTTVSQLLNLKNCILKISLGGSYPKEIEKMTRVLNEKNEAKKDQIQMAVNIHYFN